MDQYHPTTQPQHPGALMPTDIPGKSDLAAPLIFGVIEMIEAGKVDRYLLRLRSAIEARRRTDAYQNHLVARADRLVTEDYRPDQDRPTDLRQPRRI